MERRTYAGLMCSIGLTSLAGCTSTDTNPGGEDETRDSETTLSVTNLSVAESTVTVGDSIDVTVTVENTEQNPATTDVVLQVNQGIYDSKEVSVDSEGSETLEFEVETTEPRGYTLVVEDVEEHVEAVATEVSGQLTEDTTWSVSDGPYLITDTIQVPEQTTLTIDPGVKAWANHDLGRDPLFKLHGEILAEGTSSDPIRIDGNGTTGTFFDADGSTPETFLSAEHCVFEDGGEFWMRGPGGFDLRHSELRDMRASYIWYPYFDTRVESPPPRTEINIEYNSFVDSGGFSVGLRNNQNQDDPMRVIIRHNRFEGWVSARHGGLLNNWNSRGDSEMVVEYNSFIGMTDEVVLSLPEGYENAALSAPNNYWGTTDESTIEGMIYDENDDINSAGIIEYAPILDEPHSDTPTQ